MINVVYSTEHWIMPHIVMGILAVLLVAIIVTEGRARVAKGGTFFVKPGRFFKPNADYVKLFGTFILFCGYIICMDILGFTSTSIIFVFLFNVLYAGTKPKSLLISALIAIVGSILVSLAFGVWFQITLPSGALTLTFVDQGFTIY
ncbi:MAG: tripartite tricarboxylate transporter TctB family protein [Oribacterium sp.]|nr:tripartite tricarboxylate transporter TctB family protein [Oribacterium sp.]MDY6306711.1 tripartite tricarboxylate transporter TctB family protein [Oribacterium sp.]MDY6317797.1 tripartite tricarboxylate transporter TctB family protein [Oribacterium sp.]